MGNLHFQEVGTSFIRKLQVGTTCSFYGLMRSQFGNKVAGWLAKLEIFYSKGSEIYNNRKRL